MCIKQWLPTSLSTWCVMISMWSYFFHYRASSGRPSSLGSEKESCGQLPAETQRATARIFFPSIKRFAKLHKYLHSLPASQSEHEVTLRLRYYGFEDTIISLQFANVLHKKPHYWIIVLGVLINTNITTIFYRRAHILEWQTALGQNEGGMKGYPQYHSFTPQSSTLRLRLVDVLLL